MNIVLEGPDGSGKSTIAQLLSQSIGWDIVASKGPCRSQEEFDQRYDTFMALDNTIFDRHCVVSERIYGEVRGFTHLSLQQTLAFYKKNNCFFIYCEPLVEAPHVIKDHDTVDHLSMIADRAEAIHRMYRNWAMEFAHIIRRSNVPSEEILRIVRGALNLAPFDPLQDVEDFHRKFGIDYPGKPRMLEFETLQFRLKFIREEISEYEHHCDAALFELDKLRGPSPRVGELQFDNANLTHEMAQTLDALVDMTYVVLGTAHLHGYDFREAWRRVHLTNMAKQRHTEEMDAQSRQKLKIIKPKGWEAPKHDDLVENHAHPKK